MEHSEKLATLHRYPMKSMMGEELNAGYIAQRGLFGDRLYALSDAETGKVAQADLPKDPEILKTAARYNEVRVGIYASVIQTGAVRAGDTIALIAD